MVETQAHPHPFSAKIQFWQPILWLVPFGLYGLALIFPVPGQIGLFIRYGFGPGTLLIAGLLYLTLRIRNRIGEIISFSLVLLLFALSLDGLWVNALSEMQVLGGMIFFSDAFRYYGDAQSLLAGGTFSSFSVRHPLAPGILTTFLSLFSHNLQITLAVEVALSSTFIYLAGREVKRIYGPLAGTVFLLLLFLFYRRFTGLIDCENLGIGLGALSFAAFLQGSGKRDPVMLGAGIFLQALGLVARPGAFLSLPLQAGWFSSTRRGNYQKILIMALAAVLILLPFLMQTVVVHAVYGKATSFSNYAYTLYGIASGGKGWEQFQLDYPEYNHGQEVEAEQAAGRIALEKIRSNPIPAMQAATSALGDFISLRDASLFGWISGGDLTATNKTLPGNERLYILSRLIAVFLTLAGLWFLLKTRKNLRSQLILWSALGILLTIPLVPPRDAGIMRVYAVSIPFLAILPAVGAGRMDQIWGTETSGFPDPYPYSRLPILSTGLILSIILLLGPVVLKVTGIKPAHTQIACSPGKFPIEANLWTGSYLHITREPTAQTHVPTIRKEDFLYTLARFPYYQLISSLATMDGDLLILNAFNLQAGQPIWLVIRGYNRDWVGRRVAACGVWERTLLEEGLGFLVVDPREITTIPP
jgi:hypothetical protein